MFWFSNGQLKAVSRVNEREKEGGTLLDRCCCSFCTNYELARNCDRDVKEIRGCGIRKMAMKPRSPEFSINSKIRITSY